MSLIQSEFSRTISITIEDMKIRYEDISIHFAPLQCTVCPFLLFYFRFRDICNTKLVCHKRFQVWRSRRYISNPNSWEESFVIVRVFKTSTLHDPQSHGVRSGESESCSGLVMLFSARNCGMLSASWAGAGSICPAKILASSHWKKQMHRSICRYGGRSSGIVNSHLRMWSDFVFGLWLSCFLRPWQYQIRPREEFWPLGSNHLWVLSRAGLVSLSSSSLNLLIAYWRTAEYTCIKACGKK